MRKLPVKYDEVKQTVKNQLDIASSVCLTTDIWISRTTQGYMTVTCHFIDELWQLKSFVLETFHLHVAHTAENIAAELTRIAREWNVSEKVVALVTDNAANAIAAARITGWKHVPCFAHTLNLIVKVALEADPGLVLLKKKCKDVVTFFHHSAKASDKLSEIQKQVEIPENKLIQDVETRWNSTFYMFQHILEQHDAITTTLCLQGKSEMCFTPNDLKLLKNALDVLRPFELATTEMSGENYVCISKIIPMARSLQLVTVGNKESLPLKNCRLLNLEANPILAKCTLLDPCLKKLAFWNNASTQGVQLLVQEMASLVGVEDVQDVAAPAVPSSDILWKEFDSKVANSRNGRHGRTDALFETRHYFEDHLIPREDDPMAWLEHSKHFPFLGKLAKKYLCITATSVPSGHLFSKAGELVSHKRSHLKPKNVDMFLFLNQNM